MPGFADFLVSETARVLAGYGLAVSPETHFASILGDRAYAFSEGTVVPAFRAAFEQRLGNATVS